MASSVPISSPAARAVEQPFASAALLWSGRILTALVALFRLFDGVAKVMKVSSVLAASARLGLSENLVATGVTPPLSTILVGIPRTSILGAMLLGAVSAAPSQSNGASEIRASAKTLFPVYFGVPVWPGLYFPQSSLARAGSFAKLI